MTRNCRRDHPSPSEAETQTLAMITSNDTTDIASFETSGPLDNGWKTLRIDGRTWIVPDFTVARNVFGGLATTFLVVCWGVATIRGLDTLTVRIAVACTAIVGMQTTMMLIGLRKKERRGTYLESASSRSIRLPRNNLTLSAEEIESLLITEGQYETSELSFRVLRLSIATRSNSPSIVPIMTTSHEAELERAALCVAKEIGVPVRRISPVTRR